MLVFMIEMLLLKVMVLKSCVEEKQIVFHQNCIEMFCFLLKNAIFLLFLWILLLLLVLTWSEPHRVFAQTL